MRLDLLLAALICLAQPLGETTTGLATKRSRCPARCGGGGSVAADSAGDNDMVLDASRLAALHLGSWPWWAARAVMLQQRVLHGRSDTLRAALMEHLLPAAAAWASTAAPAAGAGAAAALRSAMHLESSLVAQQFGRVADAEAALHAAADALGVCVEVSGALGFRTKHQADAKPQLVASVRSTGSLGGPSSWSDAGTDVRQLGFERPDLTRELQGMRDESAVYMAPRLAAEATSDAHNSSGAETATPGDARSCSDSGCSPSMDGPGSTASGVLLPCAQQALLLGWASQIRRGGAEDELQQWQMAPYVEAVLTQRRGAYMLAATARLLKVRHERTRGRTRERALMQLEQLCSALSADAPPGAARHAYAYGVRFPLWPLLRKELAEMYIAMGCVGAQQQAALTP